MNEIKKLNLRLPVDLMEEAKAQADAMGISLNAYCLLAIRNFISYTQRGTPKLTARQQAAVRDMAGEPPQAAQAAIGTRRPTGALKVGRNDPCPCGSGRKAKHCHPASC